MVGYTLIKVTPTIKKNGMGVRWSPCRLNKMSYLRVICL